LKYVASAHPGEATFTGRAERIKQLLHVANASPGSRILDIGCGYGDITLGLSKNGYEVIGADVFLPGVRAASKVSSELHLDAMFLMSPVESLGLRNEAAGLAICYNLWEHVENPQALLNQVARVLRQDGILFMVVPNRFWIMETHYRLPLLSWLPRRLANGYLRITGRGTEYDVNCPTWWEFDRSLRSSGFEVTNLNLYVMKNFKKLYPTPEYLGNAKYRAASLVSQILRCLPDSMARLLSDLFSEAFFVVARKARVAGEKSENGVA
jgi:ubiquinone/menaquinone biosynthesis C-methylase UbiE